MSDSAMLLERPRPHSKPLAPTTDDAREDDLAAELARILSRPPRRAESAAVHPDGPGAQRSASAASRSIEPDDIGPAAAPSEGADTEPAEESGETASLPPWARGRRLRRATSNARMVGASLIAVAVVVAIIGGVAMTLFGGARDVQALKQMLFSTATTALPVDRSRM